MFYENGYMSSNVDLALIAFTTTLEGLFSTVEQEISFRLSLRVAQFLSGSETEMRKNYQNAREVYRVRSKIVHGAPVRKDSAEQAAIYLVEGIAPLAEELARKCLWRIFEMKLEALFSKGEKLDALFDSLLFSHDFGQAVRDAGSASV